MSPAVPGFGPQSPWSYSQKELQVSHSHSSAKIAIENLLAEVCPAALYFLSLKTFTIDHSASHRPCAAFLMQEHSSNQIPLDPGLQSAVSAQGLPRQCCRCAVDLSPFCHWAYGRVQNIISLLPGAP